MDGLIVVPLYNEALGLQQVLDQLGSAVPTSNVLFVDDGSADGSTEMLTEAGVRHVRHPLNLGYEEALRTGMTYALRHEYAYVVFFDADGQHRTEDLLKVIALYEEGEAEVVLGSRYRECDAGAASLRFWGTRLFSRLTSRLTGVGVTDVTCGLKLISREFLPTALSLPMEDMHAELITGLSRCGARIQETAIQVRPRESGKSMYHLWKAVCYPFKTLLCVGGVLLACFEIRNGRARSK